MHTHSHYRLFLIGLRHCRKLVPRICQSVSQPTDVSERKPGQHSQVHLFGWRDRSADQCLLCAAGSSTKRKWSLSIGPNSCPTCTALGRAGLASQLPKQPQQLQEISLLHPPAFPQGHPPNPDSVNPQCLWLSLTPAAQGAEICLTPEPQWDMSHNTPAHHQKSLSSTQESKHTSH